MSNFEIPQGNADKLEVELIPRGMQLCGLYGIADIGTQETNFGAKRQMMMFFEFPQHVRVFWKGEDPKPASIFVRESMNLSPRSNLRKRFIEPMLDRKLGDKEGFDPTTLLGTFYVGTVTHSDDENWANMSSIAQLNETNMKMFDLTTPAFIFKNTSFHYHLNDGFEGDAFKNLSKYLREKIQGSEEGKAHKLSGGKFAEPEEGSHGNSNAGRELVMNPGALYSLEALRGNNWSDEQIVAAGYATFKSTAPAPPPLPQLPPAAPVAPVAPVPPVVAPPIVPNASPSAPPAFDPHISNGRITLIEAQRGGESITRWLETWTEELMIQHGHATVNPK